MSNNLKPYLARVAAGETLSEAESETAFGIIMAGDRITLARPRTLGIRAKVKF